MDQDGILRLRNYLPYFPYAEEIISPILFHPNSALLKLVVLHVHLKNCHAGTKFTLAAFRRHYFVPKCQKVVTQILRRNCALCNNTRSRPYQQPSHPSLPDFRLVPFTTPFTYTGVDIFGPFQVFKKYLYKSKKQLATPTSKLKKVWGLIFTCLSTRAVHLLSIDSLTTEDIWDAFNSFFADRGTPKHILSDNAAQFKLLAMYLPEFWDSFANQSTVARDLREANITWSFTPAKAPWYGGVYERVIQLVKEALYKSLSHNPVKRRLFSTVLKRIQSMLNERPLCPSSDDAEQWTLTPAHFLRANLGSCTLTQDTILPVEMTPTAANLARFIRQDQHYNRLVWLQWKQLYLTYLRDKVPKAFPNAYRTSEYVPRVGEIVHVLDFESKPGVYKLAKVKKLLPSQDGKIRQVEIEFPSKITSTRPVKFLAPLEVAEAHAQNVRTCFIQVRQT
ncbi:unnamed protein product [Brugia timori]|uniref:Integrase catalytic domain-containing protein n=1 Tax=Brugia timori TaxID=42155 RepID=A0A0R3QCN7_9BILA|nr:unnamed protein product [Brugia timori]